MTYVKPLVSKKNIIAHISEYDIFKYYISNFQEVGCLFCSELRVDKNPTCLIYRGERELLYRDFAYPQFYDWIGYVQAKFNCSFREALNIVALDFKLPFAYPCKTKKTLEATTIKQFQVTKTDTKIFKKSPAEIKILPREWNNTIDKFFWKDRYGITTKELNYFKVIPITGYWINNIYYSIDTPAYAYYLGKEGIYRELWKLYFPHEKKKSLRFLGNPSSRSLQGLEQLPWVGDKLVITKSLKDVIVLYKLGIASIAVNGEAQSIPEDLATQLKKRFKQIVILFDNDSPGYIGGLSLSYKLQIPVKFLPKCSGDDPKDCSDYVRKFGYQALSSILVKLKLWEEVGK